ncbi:MAG: enoyl-CoA hydratase/isomerase family protein [Alphaproteobacteria bacterium]
MAEEAPILVERAGAVATVTLNRPQVLNALDMAMAEALRAAMLDLEHDADVRCVVIRGAGRGFMAGGDVAGFHRDLDRIETVAGGLIEVFHEAVKAVARMPKPVLASLHGPVAGAGLSLALATDLAIAADTAVFTLAYANIGTSPDGGATFNLPRLAGMRRAMEIALLADRFDGAKALDLGLVNRVVPEADLAGETERLASRLAAGPTRAYSATKTLIRAASETDLVTQLDAERAAFVASTATRDFAAGVVAFTSKTKPDFSGE